MLRRILLVLITGSGCFETTANECGGGGVCPQGLMCVTAGTDQLCVLPTCGNGRLDPGEPCDDGNNFSCDGCPSDCTQPCGDGIVDPGETCDDGNTTDGDGCSANCQSLESCGNGTLDPGEACDDA